MKIVIAAGGKFRSDAEKTLYERYIQRLPWKTSLIEVDDKRSKDNVRRRGTESQKLLEAIPEGAIVIPLDESGTALSSTKFANKLGKWQDQGLRDIVFLIGGADGLDSVVLDRANLVLSLGPMTWPHLLVRGLLAEQLYRASTVLSGHPYHRA